jgi:hypothetical protein
MPRRARSCCELARSSETSPIQVHHPSDTMDEHQTVGRVGLPLESPLLRGSWPSRESRQRSVQPPFGRGLRACRDFRGWTRITPSRFAGMPAQLNCCDPCPASGCVSRKFQRAFRTIFSGEGTPRRRPRIVSGFVFFRSNATVTNAATTGSKGRL